MKFIEFLQNEELWDSDGKGTRMFSHSPSDGQRPAYRRPGQPTQGGQGMGDPGMMGGNPMMGMNPGMMNQMPKFMNSGENHVCKHCKKKKTKKYCNYCGKL